jgi:DNA replication licensing factor MCM2
MPSSLVLTWHVRCSLPSDGHFGAPVAEELVLPQAMLRKYITYAKTHCKPKLQHADMDKISRVYAELRKESMARGAVRCMCCVICVHALTRSLPSFGAQTREGMPVAVRHIESIIRMSEAHAAMHLREQVVDADVDVAISVMIKSFVATQKFGVQKALQKARAVMQRH